MRFRQVEKEKEKKIRSFKRKFNTQALCLIQPNPRFLWKTSMNASLLLSYFYFIHSAFLHFGARSRSSSFSLNIIVVIVTICFSSTIVLQWLLQHNIMIIYINFLFHCICLKLSHDCVKRPDEEKAMSLKLVLQLFVVLFTISL